MYSLSHFLLHPAVRLFATKETELGERKRQKTKIKTQTLLKEKKIKREKNERKQQEDMK